MERTLTAAEKIMALKANFDSMVKSLNKKVSFERNKKRVGCGKKHVGKGGQRDDGNDSKKKDDKHLKK